MDKGKINWFRFHFVIILLCLVSILSTGVRGADCGGATACACGDTITADYTMTSNLNCGATRGLTISANDIDLNCDGYTINGTGDYALVVVGNYNTVSNCVITNYQNSLLSGTEKLGHIIQNNIFINTKTTTYGSNHRFINNTFNQYQSGAFTNDFLTGNNVTLINNLFNNSVVSFRLIMDGIYLYNNTFQDYTQRFFPPALRFFADVQNIVIDNNNFTNLSQAINFENLGIVNATINNSIFYDITNYTAIESYNTSDITIDNSVFNLGTRFITFRNSGDNIKIINSVFNNSWRTFDQWNVPLYFSINITDVLVENNNIDNFGSAGIVVRDSKDYKIYNNTFDEYSISEKIASGSWDLYEPTAAIKIVEIFKNYNISGNPNNDGSDNVSILDNNFGYNVQTYLYSEGTTNLTHDVTGWNYSYRLTNLSSNVTLINNNNFDKLSNVQGTHLLDQLGTNIVETDFFYYWINPNFPLNDGRYFNYSISKTAFKFENINDTDQNATLICPFDSQTYTIGSGESWVFNGCDAGVCATENCVFPYDGINTSYNFYRGIYPNIISITNDSSSIIYDIPANWINFTVNETSSSYHLINFSTGGFLKWFGNDRKYMSITNNTVTWVNNTAQLVFNSTRATPYQINTQGISSGERVFIFTNFAGQPYPTSIATTINRFSYSWDGAEYTWSQQDTGSTTLNTTALMLYLNDYDVVKDNVLLNTYSTPTYTMSGIHTWLFTHNYIVVKTKQESIQSLSKFTDKISIIATVLIAVFIISLLYFLAYKDKLNMELSDFVKISMILVLIALFLMVGLDILGGL